MLCIAALPVSASALTIHGTHDTEALTRALFGDLPGVSFAFASLSHGVTGGSPAPKTAHQASVFSNAAGTYGLPASGVALSTGDVREYAAGPDLLRFNQTQFASWATDEQQALLAPITGQLKHFDVVSLDFQFTPPPDVVGLTFRTVYGSEDHPEFGGAFADGFGLFVNGANIARAPAGAPAGAAHAPLSSGHPDFVAVRGTELNGVIAPGGEPVLRFDVALNPGAANRVTLLLADGADRQTDTTVFLSGGFVRLAEGLTEAMPVLPADLSQAESFLLDIPEVPAGVTVWIDPPVSVGFEYVVNGGALFASVTAPSFEAIPDADGYTIHVGALSAALAVGQTLDFPTVFGLLPDSFTLLGIDPGLVAAPPDPLMFPTGVSFERVAAGTTVTMSAIIEDIDHEPEGGVDLPGGGGFTPAPAPVPVPGALALLLGALAAFGAVGRRGGWAR